MKSLLLGICMIIVLALPPMRELLESVMIVHMLIQLPLLIIFGWIIGKYLLQRFPGFFAKWNGNGIPGIIIVIFVTTYWMIPRAVDEALTYPAVELFKFISLPIVGILLADSWKKILLIGRSFVFLNYLSMFGLMAWLYIDAPIQICNNYLVAEQKALGWGFVIITAAMVLFTLQYVFIDHSENLPSE